MIFKEAGFRPIYHYVCAFEMNAMLRELTKECPDAAKASHAVFYGYMDPKKGIMLELLGVGKQAPKYFYFKEPYEGRKVSIPASDVEDVEFMYFPDLEPRFRKKYEPKIAKLKKYDASEDLEKSREFGFLDGCRDQQHPDDVRVLLTKPGLKPEEVWVRLTGLGDHVLIGTLLNQPFQDYGFNKGDTINFNAKEDENKNVVCYLDLSSHELTKEDLADGSFLKDAVADFEEKKNDDTFAFVLAVLRSSVVCVPCDIMLSDEAKAILDKHRADESEMSPEEIEIFNKGMSISPNILENSDKQFFPVFSSEEEMGDHENVEVVRMPFLHAINMALDGGDAIQGIVLNAFTGPFVVDRELFGTIAKMEPLFEEEEEPEQLHTNSNQTSFSNSDAEIDISVGKMDVFNYALYQNNVPPIRGVLIQNRTGDPINGLTLRITSDFHFFKKYEMPLPPIPSGKPITLPDPHLIINGNTLATMTETVNAIITVELCKDGEGICGCRGQMQVFAYDQWQGGETYQDLLPAFVLPNHPVIPALMHDAADRLQKWGKSPSLEGYQAHDPNRVRELAAAAYAAIQKKNIIYAEPPASFSIPGQRIRTPETIMEQRLGTCMDMTLLYAATLEAMGLHPLLVMMKGHIFAGVWLKERTPEELKSGSVVIDNLEELTMRINNGSDEMTFIECTTMCSGKQVSFEESEKIAKLGNLTDASNFRFAIDVFSSRIYGVKPITSRVKDGAGYQIEVEEKPEDEVTDAPTALDISITDAQPTRSKKIMNKRDLWESKLLDLSQHNMLLNLPLNASVQPIMSSHIDELEDALADGHEFHLLPVAEWIAGLAYTKKGEDGKESKPIQWLPEAIKENGIFELTQWPVSSEFDFNEKFRQEYRNHRLYTFCGQKQLDRELTSIYRAARSSQQENGVSSLYLAVGLLRWFPDAEADTPCYAPLILLPIEIIRKSANQGYALHARDEEPHFNTTLLEMLKQNFNIEINGLDPLPSDEHGIDIKKAFALVRGALYTVKNWDVVESCVVGNFSFAQFAMWNDIHTAGDCLENSKIVRSLMKGHVDWDVTAFEETEEENTYLPITVDATQLKAVKMAAHGKTFVLHGPPGTGKSQTITGMIANLMAQGKSVLFVAEKMAALSVVQKRLASLGIGDFCLELHSDKANKKQVLTQLDKALAVKHPSKKTEYEDALRKTQASRSKLDGYAKHLHLAQNCGYSLRELIDLYEMVRDHEASVRFTRSDVSGITKADMKNHVPLIGQLMAAGESMEAISEHPLLSVGLTSYSAEIRAALRPATERYQVALHSAFEHGAKVSVVFADHKPEKREDIVRLVALAKLYLEHEGTETLILDLLAAGTKEAYEFFEYEQNVAAHEDAMLHIWRKEFLTQDMNAYLSKHEAAGKKFFGKAGAMAAVTAEIQAYAYNNITYEQIPFMLRGVIDFQREKASVQDRRDSLSSGVKALVSELQTKDKYCEAYAMAVECQKQANQFPGGLNAIIELAKKPENHTLFVDFVKAAETLWETEDRFNGLLSRAIEDTDDWMNKEEQFCEYLMAHPSALKEWGIYNQVRQECIKVGLKPVVDAFESKSITGDLVAAYKKGIYYALINLIIGSDDILSSFSGATFNESIQHFKNLDDAMLQHSKDEIFYLLASRVPTAWDSPAVGMELNLLRKAIGSNARGMSIRTLFERIPNVLKGLCPCMLMSPNSVAQYLAHDNNLFDVVIFDEASQLPTCKAIGALSRAKDAVIVGDPKQMPPTSFFAGSGPEVDDLALDDLDSILDDALALGIPSQHLQWHYRSTHESLIAFSNSQFYENKMYTFPSANDRERHVTAVHVDGVYNKSTNIKEAEAVVAEIVRRFHDPVLCKQSIGVVTFNVKQQTLIENLLAKQFQVDAALDAWANNGEDALFVKNLENVQGDERDVILFSIGYGPDEKGRISMNFGPINKTGGGKRLNVAFSRARVTMTIFSSIYSSDIKVTESSPEGLVAFRDFLKFAEGHDIHTDATAEAEARLAKAGILQSICKAITDHGLQCETMVGHSDFHVDIAVIDPFEPTKYMMGILLDGDGYKQTTNTRDREVAQIGVLKHLGWAIHRIWTIDWWDNRDKVLRRLIKELDELKAISEKRDAERKAELEAHKDEIASREAEAELLKAELAAQVAEVVADDEEADRDADKMQDVPVTVIQPITEKQPEQPVVENKPVGTEALVEEKPVATIVPSEEVANSDDNSQPEDNSFGALIDKLTEAGGKIVDKRENGGALWVIGGKNLSPIMKELKAAGISFIFKAGGGKATGGKDGWWAKTDVVLPGKSSKTTPKAPVKEPNGLSQTPVVEVVDTTAPVSQKVADAEPAIPETPVVSEQLSVTGYAPIDYVVAEVEQIKWSAADFIAAGNKNAIAARATEIVAVEGPILKDCLMRKLLASYGVNKTTATIEAAEKALKAAKIKNSKLKGVICCWTPDQDPKTYTGIRVTVDRSADEIPVQEIKNAACYVLQQKSEMDKDVLIKEISLVFGYKRLGKNLETAIDAGIQYAKSVGAIQLQKGGVVTLPSDVK